MSAEILDNRHTIDLTGVDTDDDDEEVVFLGASRPARARTPLRPPPVIQQRFNPPGGWQQQPGEHEEPILVESDDDELEEQVVDRLIPPHPPVHIPPPPGADPLRIFSPPAQFRPPPPRDPTFLNRRPTPHPYGDHDFAPPPPPRPAPAMPARIGLGGGFMAFRERARPTNSHNRDNERRMEIPHWIRTVLLQDVDPGNFFYPQAPAPPRPPVQVPIPQFGGMVWDAGRNEAIGGPVDYQPWHIAGDDRLEPPKPTYGPIMTHHKEKPSPGFTFDFEPSATAENAPIVIDVDESQASSSSSAAATVATPSLICARCSATLRMGSKTMWGLRCGHVVCGGCGEYLSRPVEGKGKGKAEEEDGTTLPRPDVKGKGKARASKRTEDASTEVEASPPRRRTRSKATRAPTTTRALRASTLQASAESVSQASTSTTPTAPPTNSRKRKIGKKRDLKPVLLQEYEYACPVEGCFRPHFSEKWKQPKQNVKERDDGIVEMEEVWKPKADLGAIPIFT